MCIYFSLHLYIHTEKREEFFRVSSIYYTLSPKP